MENLYEKLQTLLKAQENYCDNEGDLNLILIQDKAYNGDADLMDLLLGNPAIQKQFFTQTAKALIFKRDNFIDYISDKNFLANSYTKYKNKIGLGDGKKYLKASNDVVLMFPFKDCVLEGGMSNEDEGRKEIFYNEILTPDEIDRLFAPKLFINAKRVTADGEQIATGFNRLEEVQGKKSAGTITDNLLIKGNNLLALHSLKAKFKGKVKLIYIDPPYNTDGPTNSFLYNNNFNHSSWLTFMKNRLEISKTLLREDGFIAIAIDHYELFYLGALADEIFSKENRIGIVSVYINPKGRQHERFFSASTEYMLIYAKNPTIGKFNKVTIDSAKEETFNLTDENGKKYRLDNFARERSSTTREAKPDFWYPIYVSEDLSDITLTPKENYHEIYPLKGNKEYTWKIIPESFLERNEANEYVAKKEDGKVKIYNKYYEQQVFKNLWTDKKYFPEFQGTNVIKKLFGKNVFTYPKSIYLVQDTIKIMTSGNDIILDFFAGSGTTAHAVLDLNKQDGGNRQFILCEQMDYIETVTKARIKKVMENNANEIDFNQTNNQFIYMELTPLNQTLIDAITEAENLDRLLKIRDRILQSYFYKYDMNYQQARDDQAFIALDFNDQKQTLITMLDKNQLYVNYSERTDTTFKCNPTDITLSENFYNERNK